MKKWIIAGIVLVLALASTGCSIYPQPTGLRAGCYTAQTADSSNGWKDYLVITVKNGEIVAAEYNSQNASGFVKSWDNAYMNRMKSIAKTYPNEYTRYYADQLIGQREMPEVDTMSGATFSGIRFEKLAQAVVEQALKGDSSVVIVE